MSDLITLDSKRFHSQRLKKFWDERWKERQDIYNIAEKIILDAECGGDYYKSMVKDCIRKLYLEKIISIEDALSIWKQIKSVDHQARIVGLHLLRIKAPTRFHQSQ